MRRVLLILALGCVAVLAATASGVAQSDRITDASGDVEGEPARGAASADIVRLANGHTKDGRLWHSVSVAGSAANPSKGTIPSLYIEVPNRANGTSECTYFVGRDGGKLGVFTCGYAERVASARIVRTSKHTIKYTFSKKAIGNPRWYDWAFVVIGQSDGTRVHHDRAPSPDEEFLRHQLR